MYKPCFYMNGQNDTTKTVYKNTDWVFPTTVVKMVYSTFAGLVDWYLTSSERTFAGSWKLQNDVS